MSNKTIQNLCQKKTKKDNVNFGNIARLLSFFGLHPPPYDDYSKVGLDFRASERGTACDSLP